MTRRLRDIDIWPPLGYSKCTNKVGLDRLAHVDRASASGAEGGGFESRVCHVENDAKSLQHNDLAK